MSYRVIYLDGRKIEGKGRLPEIGCDVCRDIERNVIEPVAIFVEEKKVEEIESKLIELQKEFEKQKERLEKERLEKETEKKDKSDRFKMAI